MAEGAAGPHDAGQGAGQDAGSGTWPWLLPALAFLAGAALSAGLFVIGDTDDAGSGEVAAGPTAQPEPEPSPTPDGLVVQVPAVCVEAAELAGTVSAALGDVVDAAGALDARRLQESLDVIQKLRPQVESTATACRDLGLEGRVVTPETSAATVSPVASSAAD